MGIDNKAFLEGDVYIDFPFAEVMFRWVKAGSRVFGKFYGGEETASSFTSDLFRSAQLYGRRITAKQYAAGKAVK